MKKKNRGILILIGVIIGEKGTGKTKQILNLANDACLEAKGSIVFIDFDNSYMYDVSNRIRYINAADYGIRSPKMLFGFLCGIAAMDFDLEKIYIDGLIKIARHDVSLLQEMFEELDAFMDRRGIELVVSINSSDKTIPEYLSKYILIQES